jgi:hypothetical protein
MKSYLLETIAAHLGENDSALTSDTEDRKLLRLLFVQHAFLLNAIESDPTCQELVNFTMSEFLTTQREELKPEEKSPIIHAN